MAIKTAIIKLLTTVVLNW